MSDKNNRYHVPALDKGLAILEALGGSQYALGTSDIADLCNLPKSSVFAILYTLENRGYVTRDGEGKFRLSMKLSKLAMSTLSKLDVREISHPHMETLAKELGYTVHLATFIRGKAVYIDKVPGPGFIQFSTKIGDSQALHNSAVGKVLAAYLPEFELDAALKENGMAQTTPNTMTITALFKDSLQAVRQFGYAIEDEEGELGVRCIGAPIYDSNGVVAALSVTAIRNELPSTRFTHVGETVKTTCLRISRELGFVPSED